MNRESRCKSFFLSAFFKGQGLILLFKLLTTPGLILGVTMLTRRFGPVLGGLLMGIPLTTGPISFFLAHEFGTEFAAKAATSSLFGQVSTGAFCLAYAVTALRFSPVVSALSGLSAFATLSALFSRVDWGLTSAILFFVVALVVIAHAFPTVRAVPSPRTSPVWDIPLRMALGAGFVTVITLLANQVGPHLSGLIAPMPVIALVLAVFIHSVQGGEAAGALLRSVVLGSPAFGMFFLTLVATLPVLPLPACYALAAFASLMTSAAIGLLLRRNAGREAAGIS